MNIHVKAFVHGMQVETFYCEVPDTIVEVQIITVDLTHIKAMNNGPPPDDRQTILPFLEEGHEPKMPA